MSRSSSESLTGSPLARIRSMTSSRTPARRAAPTWAAHTYAASRSRTAERMATERSFGSTTLCSRLKVTNGSRRSASPGLCSRMLNGPRTPPNTLTTSSTTWWCSAGTSDLPVTGAILGIISSMSWLNARIRLAPAVEIDDLGERPAPDRPKPPHRIADRQDCIGVIARRDTHRRIDLFLVRDVPGRQRRTEPESPRRQQHVLDCRINRRTRRTVRIRAILEAGDDPHRRLVVMVRQVLNGSILPLIARSIRSWRRRACRVARPDHFVIGLLIVDLHFLFDFRILQHQKAPALVVAATWSGLPCQ